MSDIKDYPKNPGACEHAMAWEDVCADCEDAHGHREAEAALDWEQEICDGSLTCPCRQCVREKGP